MYNELYHHGVKGQRWGVRRYQNKDGTLTPAGKKRAASKRDYSSEIKNMSNDELRKKVAEEWSQLNGVLITQEMINCLGCRVDGPKTPFCEKLCPIRQCVIKKNLKTCGDCSELDSCEKIQMVISNNKEAFERLKMKESD